LPQEPSVFRKLSVEENLMAILETLPLSSGERHARMVLLIEQLGLEKVRHNKGYALSGGERRRVEIAARWSFQPSFLLLDEPFSGIDPIQVLEIQHIVFELKRNGIGILVTDHNVRETLAVTGPRLHHQQRENLPRREPRRPPQRSRSQARLSRRELQRGRRVGAVHRRDAVVLHCTVKPLKRNRYIHSCQPPSVRPVAWKVVAAAAEAVCVTTTSTGPEGTPGSTLTAAAR